MLQILDGDYLFVYDIQDHNRTKIVQLDYNFNGKKKTFSNTGSHNLLIQFSTDHISIGPGFSALIRHFPSNANCANFLDETKLNLTKAMDCNWIITAPSETSSITIQFQYLEVFHLTSEAVTLQNMVFFWKNEK